MALGPIEVLVVGFPGNRFNGKILPEIKSLVERGIINVIDGVLITKYEDGTAGFREFADDQLDPQYAGFRDLISETAYSFVSSAELDQFAAEVEPNSTAAILVFEHAWSVPFRDAVLDSGGVLIADARVPGQVVDEALAGGRR
jgi:hypothetical protein